MNYEHEKLESIPLFRGLAGEELAMVAGVLHRTAFASGAAILSTGSPREAVYILVSGTVKIYVEQPGGSDVILAICGAGEVLVDLSDVEGMVHSANAVTLEPSVCLWLEGSLFLDLLQALPVLSFNLMLNTLRRLRLATTQIQSLATQDVSGRVAGCLLALALESRIWAAPAERRHGHPLPPDPNGSGSFDRCLAGAGEQVLILLQAPEVHCDRSRPSHHPL